MKPAYAASIIVLIALSGCSRDAETGEAAPSQHQEVEAASDTDALPDEARPAEEDPAMRSPVDYD